MLEVPLHWPSTRHTVIDLPYLILEGSVTYLCYLNFGFQVSEILRWTAKYSVLQIYQSLLEVEAMNVERQHRTFVEICFDHRHIYRKLDVQLLCATEGSV